MRPSRRARATSPVVRARLAQERIPADGDTDERNDGASNASSSRSGATRYSPNNRNPGPPAGRSDRRPNGVRVSSLRCTLAVASIGNVVATKQRSRSSLKTP